jgi:hypothetical protein
MRDVPIELPKGVSGMIPKIRSEPRFVRRRPGRDGGTEQGSQECNLKPGTHRVVVGAIQLESFFPGCGLGHCPKLPLNPGYGDRTPAELFRIVGITRALDSLRSGQAARPSEKK